MKSWLASFVITLSCFNLACCGIVHAQSTQPTTQVATNPTDVPVVAVKLFSSGVGYFERAGVVHDEDHTTLSFKADQINDILKSLVLEDVNGGTVGMITYPSQDPIEKTLAGYSIDISNNGSLLDLLGQLRGAKLTVVVSGESITGVLLGTERKRLAGIGDDKGEKAQFAVSEHLTILSGPTIRSIPLDSILNISLDDPQLQKDLNAALATIAGGRNQDQKLIDIAFHGTGERQVRVGYVVSAPVWKTSYRLVFDHDKPHLQGWAMVENQTDSDWNNVQLSMISGRPISFIEDLYTPIYLQRPTVQPNWYGGLQPPDADSASLMGGNASQRGAHIEAKAGMLMDAAAAPSSSPLDITSTISSLASTASLGRLFSYTVDHVTLPRHQSAMLPVVTDAVDAQRLSIFNEQTLTNHPLNGVRLKNTTDKHLLQGPITIFDHGTYAGDAQVDNLPPGESRLLSYGIDLELRVNADHDVQEVSMQSASIDKGILLIKRRTISTHDFAINNQSSSPRTLVIEDPIRPGWSLADTSKPIEATADQNRFQLDVPANESTTFTVKQQITAGEQAEILPMNQPTLLQFITNGDIPKAVHDALAKAAELKAAVTTTETAIAENNTKLKSISEEQSRIRDNMKAVDQKSDYYTRLMKKLNEQETTIEQTQSTNTTLHAQLTDQSKALNDFIANLTIN